MSGKITVSSPSYEAWVQAREYADARIAALEAELAAERERREAAEKDAARWLYARRFIAAGEVADWPKWASRGHIESFEETCATVRAIDAARKEGT